MASGRSYNKAMIKEERPLDYQEFNNTVDVVDKAILKSMRLQRQHERVSVETVGEVINNAIQASKRDR